MSYGRTAAAIELERAVKLNPRYSRKVGTIMEAFHKGINIILPINDKEIFESFLKLWVSETKSRIESAIMPEDIKRLLRNTVVGTGRRWYRTKMIMKDWAGKKHLAAMRNANLQHDNDYQEMKKTYDA
jgi:hypothetical protein